MCRTVEDVDAFFEKGGYNSCQAIEQLIISIDESQNEVLARRTLNLFQRHFTTLERPWDHVTFMYGLGLIYMHFNAYNWAVKSFRDAVYVQPSFQRSRDVHTRLGLIFKTTGRYKLSEKHFNLAIQDTRSNSGTRTKLELKFHLAHLCEIQGKTQQAIEAYEKLLLENDLPPKLSANIHRQLGWIHCSAATKSSSSSGLLHPQQNESRRKNQETNMSQADRRKLETALNHLSTASKLDSDSQTSYYLGRCLTTAGKVRDAFASYRSVKEMEETNADTWCSMGVLYQKQNQPLDALQAYIRSVQYDKKHSVAWMNLGILYESHSYFKDALKCYQHILRSNPQGGVDKSLRDRISLIEMHLKEEEANPPSSNNNGKPNPNSDKLLSLEDLWNMESKTNQESSSAINSNSNKSENSIVRPTILHKPALSTTTTSSNAMAHNERSHGMLTQNNNSKPQLPTQENTIANNQINSNDPKNQVITDTNLPCNGQYANKINHHDSNPTTTACYVSDDKKPHSLKIEASNTLINSGAAADQPQTKIEATSNSSTLNGLDHFNHKPPTSDAQVSQDIKPQSLDPRQFSINQMYTNGASKDSGISSDSSTYTDYALVPSQSSDSSTASYISAEQIMRSCREYANRAKKIDINLISDDTKPPSSSPTPYPPLPYEKLFPLAPSIHLDSKKELTAKKLFETCQSNPISIFRNLANLLKLDLGLFSTNTLVESNPDYPIHITSHLLHQNNDANNDVTGPSNAWMCARNTSSSTISHYAIYQASSFNQSLLEERAQKPRQKCSKESETDSNESGHVEKSNANDRAGPSKQSFDTQGPKSGSPNKKFKRDETQPKMVKFAHMIDISCEQSWRSQLHELNKLPHFLRCVSASNMLTHIGSAIPGLNTTTLSMQVPGCRIVGKRRYNQMCSVNLSVGPGEFEWFAIPGEYERLLRKLCNRNGFDYDNEDWWPRLEDLHKYSIPVYRIVQRPGDLVWVNSTTIYWAQSLGWANSIQWNLGPLCARQYRLTAESCELDKLLFKKSDVPMVQMTWNLVMNISVIQDEELLQHMMNVMRRSLRYCKTILDLCDNLNRKIKVSEEVGPKGARFCSLCECEVFNITFNRKQEPAVHCIECASRASDDGKLPDDYKIEQTYDLSYLMQLYDNMIENRKKFQARLLHSSQQQQQQQQQLKN